MKIKSGQSLPSGWKMHTPQTQINKSGLQLGSHPNISIAMRPQAAEVQPEPPQYLSHRKIYTSIRPGAQKLNPCPVALPMSR